ncbi:hypothetical protein NBH00_18735 [Paraconexibacter antarcticus]|uniref:Uncharacterized protein n=1 Tax=Paraconexibacter antarcticus TaxID=2949664 RepID=A0ABY5DRQ1_9ACTN|nr:hypothetical protein [Paraconexibacter antarcticus]UTI63375.1 hypothetical protein NBH00_18735 [Paraconexibacter antarcticus]
MTRIADLYRHDDARVAANDAMVAMLVASEVLTPHAGHERLVDLMLTADTWRTAQLRRRWGGGADVTWGARVCDPHNVLSSLVRQVLSIVAVPLRLLPGGGTSANASGTPDARGEHTTPAGVAARRSGKYETPLINAIRARPGITVAEAAASLDTPATALYPTIRRLQAENRLVKHGRGLHPS